MANYTISKKYAFGASEGASQRTSSRFIILHDVGAESGAAANASYFKHNWSTAQTYVAFVVGDGGKVYQVGEPGYVQWGALDANPYSPVQIELGHTTSKTQFKKDYAAYVSLARDMAKKYGIPLTLDTGGQTTKGIKTHLWVTNHFGGDHVDPYGYLKRFGITKEQLAKDLKNGVSGTASKSKTASKKYTKNDYYRFNPKKVKVSTKLDIYSSPAFAGKKPIGSYAKGTVVDVKKCNAYDVVTRLQTSKGWISGRKDLSLNYYYVSGSNIHKVRVIKSTGGYSDLDLHHKITNVPKGVYTVNQLKKRKNGMWSIKLKSGIWMSTRKDFIKKLK